MDTPSGRRATRVARTWPVHRKVGKGRTPGKAGDSGPCGRDARAFGGELGVGRVGSHRDVVLVVAFLRGQHGHVERGSGGQKQRVSALGAFDGGGQIGLGGDANLFSRRRCSVERSVVTGLGKFGGAVLGAKLRDIALTAEAFSPMGGAAASAGSVDQAKKAETMQKK